MSRICATATASTLPAAAADHGPRPQWDERLAAQLVRIVAGEYYVSRQGEVITTVLGSCISACVRDVHSGIGGMNHFMLPGDDADRWAGTGVSAFARYGSYAMEQLINSILKAGGERERLEVKEFGGGNVLPSVTDIGQRNIAFVLAYLRTEELRMAASDLGGPYPRRINYFPATGRVDRKRLPAVAVSEIAGRERSYEATLRKTAESAGTVDLF